MKKSTRNNPEALPLADPEQTQNPDEKKRKRNEKSKVPRKSRKEPDVNTTKERGELNEDVTSVEQEEKVDESSEDDVNDPELPIIPIGHDKLLMQFEGSRPPVVIRKLRTDDDFWGFYTKEGNQYLNREIEMNKEHQRINAKLTDELARANEELCCSEEVLAQAKDELAQAKEELAQAKDELSRTKDELEQTKEELKQAQWELTRMNELREEREELIALYETERLKMKEICELEEHEEHKEDNQQLLSQTLVETTSALSETIAKLATANETIHEQNLKILSLESEMKSKLSEKETLMERERDNFTKVINCTVNGSQDRKKQDDGKIIKLQTDNAKLRAEMKELKAYNVTLMRHGSNLMDELLRGSK